MMKLALLQFKPKLGQVEENRAAIRRYLGRRKFDLAVLPELATTGYNFADRAELAQVAEDKKGPSFAFFADLARSCGGPIVWGMAEKSGKRIYNSAVLTTPEGEHHIYRKTHLFYRETLIFDPGDSGFKVFKYKGIRIGLMVCFDWIFPESARTLALKGAQIICHPSNLVMQYCQDAMVTRSLENGVFCVTVNRVGREKNGDISYTFTGGSQVTDIKGNRLVRFSRTEEGVKTVKINPQVSDIKRVNEINDLFADRKDSYYTI